MTEQALEALEKLFPDGCVISYFQPNSTLVTERIIGSTTQDPLYEEKQMILSGLIRLIATIQEDEIREAGAE